MTMCPTCGGKLVRVKDGATCGCGAFETRRASAVVYPAGYVRLPDGRWLGPDDVVEELSAMEADWASDLAEECF